MPDDATPLGHIVPFDDLEHTEHAHEFVGGEHGDVPFSVILVHSRPGVGPKLHRHPYAEVFIVESGQATFRIGDETVVVEGGNVVVSPPGEAHGFTNTGDGELRLVAIHGAGRFDTEWLTGFDPDLGVQAPVTLFRYDPLIVERFPSIVGGTLHVTGASSGPTPPALAEAFRAEQAATIARIGDTPLSEVPSLAAWRRAFRAFGVDPTAYRSASEALLRRLTKQGEIPSISTLVDIGNLVSIRHALPVAVFDLASIRDGLTVCFATGDESFTDLGSGTTEAPEAGEVIFIDAVGHVAARRWCWRQSAESASSASTTDMLVTVEGHHDGARDDVATAVADLEALFRAYAGPADVRIGVVGAAAAPSFAG